MKPAAPLHPARDPVRPDHVLTERDIDEFGLEEAHADAGPSWEEIADMRRQRHAEG